ncbi:MAG: ParB/RepB/Spo0J family partition protein [Alphaproteobacteria bacterium]|nr:ParB/RepB/Spo0J family partition protein [Alphaproteobacteria bacterium]
MTARDIPITEIDVSEHNTRKNLHDGQHDSTIEDLAKSIERHGLLNPIMVMRRAEGRYEVIAGQRRLLACQQLGWAVIPAIVRDSTTDTDATAISLVENVHRADMNPRDKAVALKALLDQLGDLLAVGRETGISPSTIRKYIQLLDLVPSLQEQLAAGEVKNTEALARLARKFDTDNQLTVWNAIQGFTQDVQQEIIKQADQSLGNLDDLVDQAAEGAFNYRIVRNCPFDCSAIPQPLKKEVAHMVETFRSAGDRDVSHGVTPGHFWGGPPCRTRRNRHD